MKQRGGFVSNSSSTSFMLIGYEVSRSLEYQFETENEYGSDVIERKLSEISNDLVLVANDEYMYIGYGRRIYDDCGVAELEYNQEEISNALDALRKCFDIDGNPSFYYGFIYD